MPSWLPMSWSVQMCGWFRAATVRASALEPLLQIGIRGDMLRQHLDGDGAVQAGVASLIDLALAAGAKGGLDLVGAKRGTGLEGHGSGNRRARLELLEPVEHQHLRFPLEPGEPVRVSGEGVGEIG